MPAVVDRTSKTVIIGLGNPILSDDSVGIKVAVVLKSILNKHSEIDVLELHAGGIRLMDAMKGYDRAVIVDAMLTGKNRPGTVMQFPFSDISCTKNVVCTHDTSLATALEVGRSLGMYLPAEISIIGIEAKETKIFSEELTEDVARAVPVAVEAVITELALSNGSLERN